MPTIKTNCRPHQTPEHPRLPPRNELRRWSPSRNAACRIARSAWWPTAATLLRTGTLMSAAAAGVAVNTMAMTTDAANGNIRRLSIGSHLPIQRSRGQQPHLRFFPSNIAIQPSKANADQRVAAAAAAAAADDAWPGHLRLLTGAGLG